MKITAQLDVNVVALDVDDDVTIMLDLEAPASSDELERQAAVLQIVLDRSGSMRGAPLDGAKEALIALIRRLAPTDCFGVVAFDTDAQVVVPAGPLADKEAAIAQIRGIRSGGGTDLGVGLLRGLREVKRVSQSGGTLLIVSDGHVNAGLQDVADFSKLATKAYSDGIVISTLGYGEHYDETLLVAITRAGSGNHTFAVDPDGASAAIAGEVDGLLAKSLQAVSLTLLLEPAVEMVQLYNDLPCQALPDRQLMIEIGDFYAEEQRRLLLKLKVPGKSELGAVKIASLKLEYVELPDLVEHVVTLPVAVNIVPGSEAAQRLVHPIVESERLFQEAQHAKKLASEAFEFDQIGTARGHLEAAYARLAEALAVADGETAEGIRREMTMMDRMSELTESQSSQYMSKLSRSSFHAMNRKRGRAEERDCGAEGAI